MVKKRLLGICRHIWEDFVQVYLKINVSLCLGGF
jgi:hypothetical protein